jgi:hypothetical protein
MLNKKADNFVTSGNTVHIFEEIRYGAGMKYKNSSEEKRRKTRFSADGNQKTVRSTSAANWKHSITAFKASDAQK